MRRIAAIDEQNEPEALRARLAALEEENIETAARANRQIAAAQDRMYWLDRWGLDLNALMRRRGAAELRAAVRALRAGLSPPRAAEASSRSMSSVAVVIPVKDGERYLRELLRAVEREGPDEVLVIDSGSTDASLAIARAAGVTVIEIPPTEFGHGETRNLGAERTSADLMCFLTQDATPVDGWLAAYRDAFALDERVGAAYGPHLPRPDTSPMIASELTEFFASFSPEGRPVIQRPGDPAFLSNVNACYTRACWQEIRFRDVAYSEDQAFGRDMLAAGWVKVFHPGAAVLHAHDYPPLAFMRRYFDEYRGLNHTIGHVERIGVRSTVRDVRSLLARDRRWMAEQGWTERDVARWTARGAVHHTGRKVFSALGSRADALPVSVQRRLSLESRAGAPPPRSHVETPRLPDLQHFDWTIDQHEYAAIARFWRDGPRPLLAPIPGMAAKPRLHIAVVIPPFRRGSGGHNIIFKLIERFERMGHTCSIWFHDPFGERRVEGPAVIRGEITEYFAPLAAPVFKDFSAWYGADVVMATGWQTVYPALSLDLARARVYLVNDHEPEFYATSVESVWAGETYRLGLHGIAGSPWLRDLLVERYHGRSGLFQYGVEHEVYFPRPIERRRDTIVYYARKVTPRRAVALGVLALEELHRRRPGVRIVMFGDFEPFRAPFSYEHFGIATPEELAWVFSEATVGLCLSMTNYSLIPQEMLACGLPCVDILGASAESVFGRDGAVELAAFDADAIADAMERLLDDDDLWHRRSEAGRKFVTPHTWDAAAEQVEAELRLALRLREESADDPAREAFVRLAPACAADAGRSPRP